MSLTLSITEQLIQFLNEYSVDPIAYCIILFALVVLDNTILPIPAEVGLVINLGSPPSAAVRALVLASGMTVASLLIFLLGGSSEERLDRWGFRYKWLGKVISLLRKFVARTRYAGLFLFLSVPGMPDALPIYLFSFLNRRGMMKLRFFLLTAFLAGIIRAVLVFAIFAYFGLIVD